jgi:hypothetical protein
VASEKNRSSRDGNGLTRRRRSIGPSRWWK